MELSKYELAIIHSALITYGCKVQDEEKHGATSIWHKELPTVEIGQYILDISHLLTKIEEEQKKGRK